MHTLQKARKTTRFIAMISLLALLGGCGGGDDKKK